MLLIQCTEKLTGQIRKYRKQNSQKKIIETTSTSNQKISERVLLASVALLSNGSNVVDMDRSRDLSRAPRVIASYVKVITLMETYSVDLQKTYEKFGWRINKLKQRWVKCIKLRDDYVGLDKYLSK